MHDLPAVRPGIVICGLAPSSEVRSPDSFRPVLSVKTQIAWLLKGSQNLGRDLGAGPAGSRGGAGMYGYEYDRCHRYPRVRQGDEVVLIGQQGEERITAEEVADKLGTINYEVVSEILARVPRVT